jgi:hypothetical protein
MTRFTYQELLALVDGDSDLIALLVSEGEILCDADSCIARVDLDRVLVARTLLRDLDITWPGAQVILDLRAKLEAAQARIAALESALSSSDPPQR